MADIRIWLVSTHSENTIYIFFLLFVFGLAVGESKLDCACLICLCPQKVPEALCFWVVCPSVSIPQNLLT